MAQAPDALGETVVADGAATRSERVHDGLMTLCPALSISAGAGSGRHGRPATFVLCNLKLYPRRQRSPPKASSGLASMPTQGRRIKQGEALITDSFRVATAGNST
jgi:hypothetical protein